MEVVNASCNVTFNQYSNFIHFNTTCVEDEDIIQTVNIVNIFFIVVKLLIGVLSIISNVFVLVILAWNLQKGQNSVLVSLACCDLLAGINIISGHLQLFWYDDIHSGLPCVLTACLYLLAYGGQSCTLMLLTVDRFISINYPLRSRLILSKKKLNMLIITIWTFLLILTGCCAYNNKWTVGSGCHSFVVFRFSAVVTCIVIILIALPAIMILYCIIHRVAIKHSQAIQDASGISNSLEDQMFIHEEKSLRVVSCILGLFYGSLAALLLQEAVKRIQSYSFWSALSQYIIRNILGTLFMSSAAMNPVVYHYRCQAFRDAVTKLLWPERYREQRRTQALVDLGFTRTTRQL